MIADFLKSFISLHFVLLASTKKPQTSKAIIRSANHMILRKKISTFHICDLYYLYKILCNSKTLL